MSLKCGLVGLPNSGKSTLFNALTKAGAPTAPYPFCTIEPNIGVMEVADDRLAAVAGVTRPAKTTPATVDFVDIAGLVKGASQGEGLGNQFLGHIRNVEALAHVVRCFERENVVHVYGSVDPLRDIEIVKTELVLADLQTVEKRLTKATHQAKVGDKKSSAEVPFLQEVNDRLSKAQPLAGLISSEEDQRIFQSLALLSAKPVLYVINVSERELKEVRWIPRVREWAGREGAPVVVVCGDLEAEMAELPESERLEFLKEMGLGESALNQLIREGYRILHLITFYTTVGPELRAWTIPQGTRVPQAAGKIHTDMEKGFIRAEVISYDELMKAGSFAEARDRGWLRVEGRDYVVKDGDVIHIRFSPPAKG